MVYRGTSAFLPVAESFLELRHDLFQRDIADDRENRIVWTVVSRVKLRQVFGGEFLDRSSRRRYQRGGMACAIDCAAELFLPQKTAE